MLGIRISPANGLLRLTLVGCILAMVACGGSSNSSQYMTSADQHFQAQDYPAAIIELKNALAAANDEGEALPRGRWMLGKAYLETGNMMAAAKELELAKDLNWDPNEVLPALAKALLSTGELAKVMALSTAGLEPRAASQLQAQQALAQLGQGDIWTADTYIAKAVELHPDDPDVQIAEARMLGASGDTEGAMTVIEKVLVEHPDKREAWSLKGDLLSSQKRLPEALVAFDAAIELYPDDPDNRLKRALINLYLQQLDAVAPDVEFLMTVAPKHPMTNYLQGSLDFHAGRYADSIAALTLAEPAAERYPLILFYLSGAQLVEGNQKEALRHAERQVQLNSSFTPGRMLLASIYLKSGRPGDAQRALRPILDANPTDTQALNLMAKALLMDGKTDQALRMLGTLQQMAPDSAIAKFEFGAGLLFAGQGEAANQQFEAALAMDPTLEQADILRVLSLNEAENPKEALAAAQDYAGRHPDSVQAQTLLGQKYMANEQVDEATTAFKKALALAPGDPAANHALAAIEQSAGDTEASRARYEAVLAERPDYLPTLLHLALLAAEPGNEAEMVAQLEYAIKTHPDALEPKLMLARYYIWANTPDRIPALFATLSELQQQSPEVLRLMATSQIAEQQYGKALYSLEQLVKLEPDTALAHHLLATAAAGNGDIELARVEFQRAEDADENFAPTLVSQARLAWADGDTALFDRYLERLEKLAPDAPDVLRLQAVAAQRDGDSARAIELSRQILAAAPSTTTMLELAGYLYVTGNTKDALDVVQDWVSKNPDDATARKALADQLAGLGQIEEAIQQYRDVVKLQPENADALNNLAWYLREDETEEALSFARRAVTVAPGRAPLLDTLALIESASGNREEALLYAKRAVAAAPGNPSLMYHQAKIEARWGNKSAAIEILNTILNDNSKGFAEREEATQLLASLQ